jgi:hypothetical protein
MPNSRRAHVLGETFLFTVTTERHASIFRGMMSGIGPHSGPYCCLHYVDGMPSPKRVQRRDFNDPGDLSPLRGCFGFNGSQSQGLRPGLLTVVPSGLKLERRRVTGKSSTLRLRS